MALEDGPLKGVIVADFSRVMAGPYSTMLLGDLGATVIKVEPPGGDDTRKWGPPWSDDGTSTYYLSVNRNKRSITLDLSEDADLGVAKRLVERADVLIENFKVGSLTKLGLGYDAVRKRNPGLVYCSITGYGGEVPWPGYDLVIQAVSGLMAVTGMTPHQPTKVGFPVADILTGLHATIGVLAAVRHRDVTGEGQLVEVNLLSSMLSGLSNLTGAFAVAGTHGAAIGNRHPSICPYEPFPTADRPLVVAVGNDRQFAALCDVLHLPHVHADVRFATNASRVDHRDELVPLLTSRLQTETADTWFQQLMAVGVPCGPINDIAGGIALGETLGLRPLVAVGGEPQIASPFRLMATPVCYHRPPPRQGADGEEVRRWLDLQKDQGTSDDQFILQQTANRASRGVG